MTDVTQDRGQAGAELPAADEQVLRELTERARTGGLKLTGEGGLLGRLTKMVIEGALEGELDDHLGYGKHDPEGRDGGNSRNGRRAKTVLTDTGPVEISVPRDRDSSFEPKIVAKRQRRLTGVDEMVISLSAKGLTHGEIAAHLANAGQLNTAHSFGFIPAGTSGRSTIRHVSEVQPDLSLKNTRLRISLDCLRVADYPGSGNHRVLFNFFTQNRTRTRTEDVNFNATYRIREGESAAVLNYPIFVSVAPPETGLVIRCLTVNVRNDNDESFLDLLESDSFKLGLQLAATAQPALAPLSAFAIGMTRTIAERHRNVAVQDIYLGLDFGGAATGARLAIGSYIAVQMPGPFLRSWRWSD